MLFAPKPYGSYSEALSVVLRSLSEYERKGFGIIPRQNAFWNDICASCWEVMYLYKLHDVGTLGGSPFAEQKVYR